jgi:hypothetical protein
LLQFVNAFETFNNLLIFYIKFFHFIKYRLTFNFFHGMIYVILFMGGLLMMQATIHTKKAVFTRIVLSILTVAVVMTSFLSSCGDSSSKDTSNNDVGGTTEPNTSDENSAETTELSEREQKLAQYTMPNDDFNGYEFKMILREETYYNSEDFYVEEENGDTTNDATYRRNAEIEEMLNIKIIPVWVAYASQPQFITQTVLAGDNAGDAVVTSFRYSFDAAKSGYLVDLAKMPGIDLSMPWWDQNLMSETSVMNKIYYVTGDITVVDNDGTWIMMFNKPMHEDYGLPDLYEIVKNGEWTIDKFTEFCKGVTQDLNGDGKVTLADKAGLATSGDSIRSMFFSTGSRMIQKDGEDIPYFALQNDNVILNLEKIYEIFRGSEPMVILTDDGGSWQTTQAAFVENRALFYAEVMFHLESIRAMETDFGIIPLPKASVTQEKYYTNIHSYASAAVSVLVGHTDEENRRTGIILEAFGYEGLKYLTPAYYEISLKTKFARDNDSSEMLDLILSGLSADLGYVGAIGGFIDTLVSDVVGRRNAFASSIEKVTAKVDTELAKLIDVYAELT